MLELKDKLSKNLNETTLSLVGKNSVEADALNALVSLGIARPVAEQALKKVFASGNENMVLEELIKKALKNL